MALTPSAIGRTDTGKLHPDREEHDMTEIDCGHDVLARRLWWCVR
jgi:hypothetical protein